MRLCRASLGGTASSHLQWHDSAAAGQFRPVRPPGAATCPLLPQDPYFQCPPGIGMPAVQKFLQQVDFDYHWFAGNPDVGNNELGINDVELSATFAFPIFFNSQTPLLVTPGFAVHYWSGPVSVLPVLPTDPAPADMPARTYDGYLDAAWNPQITPWFGAQLEGRYGVYSDFTKLTGNSLRFTGKGVAVLTFSPSFKIEAGVWYLDRVKVKLLPAGGIIWTPNPDVYFNILFPNPKVAKRLTTWGTTEWWLYVSGEYGGGTWTIQRDSPLLSPDYIDTVDYNDVRVAVGLEFKTLRQLHGMFEVGGSFSRELIYQSDSPNAYYPTNTVFLRAGLAY